MSVSSAFFAKFKKVMSLVGSNREGERHAAADQAFRMCDENDLSVLEALDGAFGNDAGSDDLRRQIDELEEDNRKLADAVNVLNAQQQAIPADAGKQMLQRLWSYPQARLLWTLLMASGVSWARPMLAEMTNHLHRGWGEIWNWIFLLATALHVWEWVVAEYARRGLGVTLLKTVVVIFGVSVAMFACQHDVGGCLAMLICTAVLTLPNGAAWLADRMAHSDNEFFTTLREWFA